MPVHRSRRTRAFTALLFGCLLLSITYVYYRVKQVSNAGQSSALNADDENVGKEGTHARLPQPPYLLFRQTALGEGYGRIGVRSLLSQDVAATLLPLRCDRIHFAVDRGVCLVANRGVLTTYKALIFGPDLQLLSEFPLPGVPSRVRVAPDGRVAAITVFVSGHSYDAASFSTRVIFFDLRKLSVVVEDMENFTVVRDQKVLREADFNFWGVTFANESNKFYASLATGGRTYLVVGDLSARTVELIREDVECPSLSPDNSKIAFKKKISGTWDPVHWRLFVVDLETLKDWPLAETRNIDDQVEWLDNERILYYLPDAGSAAVTNIWVVQADGQGMPHLFMPQSYSPTVVRVGEGDFIR